MAKNVLHVIESLAVGGAEVLLLNTVNALDSQYRNIVVYLNGPNILGPEFKNAELICLGHKGTRSFPSSIFKLRKIIKEYDIQIVHAHLLWPSIIARLACPGNVRLIFSVHSILSQDAFKPYPKSLFFEKLTYRARHEVIFVSEMARQDYEKYIGIKGKSHLLYNFISDDFFNIPAKGGEDLDFEKRPLNLVAVGNLKEAKNYPYLINAFVYLKNQEIFLDIYGVGPLEKELQVMIDQLRLRNVRLKGRGTNLPQLLKNYDIFVLSSEHEGFGLAAIEGMASGLPCFLSDLPVFHEVTAGNAIFFDLKDHKDFADKLLNALHNPMQLQELSRSGLKRAKLFNRENYIRKLGSIYEDN